MRNRRLEQVGWLMLVLAWVASCHTLIDGTLANTLQCGDEGAFGPPACREGERCIAGLCAASLAPMGASCSGDEECVAGTFCLEPSSVGETAARFCTKPCCAAGDCGSINDGMVCWTPGAGSGSFCRAAADLGLTTLGDGIPGANCQDDGECRSGRCDSDRCLDSCCDDSYCAAATTCRTWVAEELSPDLTWSCQIASNAANEEMCDTNDDCRTGSCIEQVTQDISICAVPCCASAGCGDILIGGMKRLLACDTVSDTALPACARVLAASATGGVGASCDDDFDCRSGLCLDGASEPYCSDMCCEDSSCGDTTQFACRPTQEGSEAGWALRCVRK